MTNLITLLGRKSEPGNAKPSTAESAKPSVTEQPIVAQQPAIVPAPIETAPRQAESVSDEAGVDFDDDNDLFVPIAAKLGEENEAIRSLLRNAEHKIAELDTIKYTIAKLVDPVSNTLRSYEEAKSEKLILQRALNNTQDVCKQLRDDLAAAQKKAAGFKAECARLQEIATTAKQNTSTLERNNAKLHAELADHRSHMVELQRLVHQHASDLQVAHVENRRHAERATAADQQVVALEAQVQTIQQQAKQTKQERAAVQASLEKSFNELAQTTRRLSDAEKALTSSQARLKAMEGNLADVHAERSQLSAALDEAVHQHRDKINLLSSRFETVQARSTMTENLLTEARQALAARADEIRALERHLLEATTAHGATAERLSGAEAALAEREAQIKDLDQERAALTEHGHNLFQVANEREVAHREAQQQIKEYSEMAAKLQEELALVRSSSDMQVEHLKAQLQREQLDRSMAEGALEAARKDMSRLLTEIGALRNRPLSQAAADASAAHDRLRQAA
jgi:crescentin